MPGRGAERKELIDALREAFESHLGVEAHDRLEVALTDGLSASVSRVDDFAVVTLSGEDLPGSTDINEANAGVVGPARWVLSDGNARVRVDIPPSASSSLVTSCLSHALELAGWSAKPLPAGRRAERLAAGRKRLRRSLRQMSIDPSRLLRFDEGVVVGHRFEWGQEPPHAVSEDPRQGPGSLTYCVLHLVEDGRGAVCLRASALAGSARPEQVARLSSSDSPVMTRHVLVERSEHSPGGDPDEVFVVSVADVDLSATSPKVLAWLVWAVATFTQGWRKDEWPPQEVRRVPLGVLAPTRTSDPFELVDWNPTPAVLVAGDPKSRPSEPSVESTSHDETCILHTPRSPHARTACSSCQLSLDEGGRHLLMTLRERGVVTLQEFSEISTALGAADPVLDAQAETRIEVKVAQRAHVRDLTELDVDECQEQLAERLGTDNPSYRAGCEVIELIVGYGTNDPVLLDGPAGLGKSRVAREVAEVLGVPSHLVPLGSTAGRHTISGSDPGFRNATRGAVVGGMVKFRTSQFMIVLDELEKLAGHSADSYPLASVLAMFDDQRASFTDWFVGSEPGWQVDLSATIFIATSNDRAALPPPILSRVRIIDVPPWTAQEKLSLARREASLIESELELEQPISAELLDLIVEGCPEPGIRELLRALKQYRTALARSRKQGGAVDPLSVFPPPPPTTVAGRRTRRHRRPSARGATRAVALTPRGWQEIRCAATPNRTRWAGDLDALGADGDTFALHWLPMVERTLGMPVPPCTLRVEPPALGPHIPVGVSIAILAAVASTVTGLVPDDRVLAAVRADAEGRLTDLELSPADVAGLGALDVGTVVVASPVEDRGLDWRRPDLPVTTTATELVELLGRLVPGLRSWERPPDASTPHGYL